ncbi:MAG: DUF1847 domain-containing protein [Fibromonadales bacterium]|nr:DUF1847 domain-containing protein [Fibromonadales bacterium]
MEKNTAFCCSDCGRQSCNSGSKDFPSFCIGGQVDQAEIDNIKELYKTDPLASKLSYSAAEVEGMYYGKLTRVEEIIAFARRMDAKKIGIAACMGLIFEAKIFVKILKANGLDSFCAICKVGSIDKTEVGIPEDLKVQKGCFEAICNPILQAKILAKQKTDLNVIIGLCVGHDSLFIKYSEAPVTTLITKDRVTGHNPAAALYTAEFYYKRLLKNQDI